MMGLAYLVFFAVYLLVSIAAVRGAIGYARKNGKSAKCWGWGAAFIMYSIVFWDWLPTVAVHQFYCAKDSGFWVYKTLDQWKAENPGVIETLVEDKNSQVKFVNDSKNHVLIKVVNQRFNWLTIQNRDVISVLPIGREENQLVDTPKNFVIARQIGFGAHDENWGGLKFWLNVGACSDRNKDMANFGNIVEQFNGARK